MKYILVLILSLVIVNIGWAADPVETKAPTAAEQEMMKYSKPDENHKALNDLVGNWKYTSKWWAAPNAKPEKSNGTSVNKWIHDGRFIQQDVSGTAMGQPFTGMAITGYDTFKKTYQSIWTDNMSTAMMSSTGSFNVKTKTLTENGTMNDPMNGMKEKTTRMETKIKNKNSYMASMYSKDPGGKEFKCMELEYTRQ